MEMSCRQYGSTKPQEVPSEHDTMHHNRMETQKQLAGFRYGHLRQTYLYPRFCNSAFPPSRLDTKDKIACFAQPVACCLDSEHSTAPPPLHMSRIQAWSGPVPNRQSIYYYGRVAPG